MTRKQKWVALILTAIVTNAITIPIVLIARRYTSLFARLSPFIHMTGMTPLHWATSDGRTSAIKKLLSKGADVNCKDTNGTTPLHIAARQGHKKNVELLIANGGDVNARQIHGWTPLHDAADCGRVQVVKLLITAGADVNARSKKGRTPLDVAMRARDEPNPFRVFMGIDEDACIQVLCEHQSLDPKKYLDRPARRAWPGGKFTLTVGKLVFFSGVSCFFVALIWFFVIAFKHDTLWGAACLMVPIAAWVFLILHWDECKKPFKVCVVGAVICLIGMLIGPGP